MAFLGSALPVERPILFSGPMVRALLAERKTQTRRIVKGVDECPHGYDVVKDVAGATLTLAGGGSVRCPYGSVGDRLWVREAVKLCAVGPEPRDVSLAYRASEAWGDQHGSPSLLTYPEGAKCPMTLTRWTPGIHMPRWACRIVLEVTAIRAERLFALTEKDAKAEGMLRVGNRWASDEGQPTSDTARRAFEDLWHSINGRWLDAWVWVVEFRRLK